MALPRAARPPLALFLAVGLAAFWRWGYAYGESDHDDFLPELYRLLDPALYPADVFVQERAGAFSVRAAFLYGLRVLCFAMPPPVAVGLVYVGVWIGLTAGVWHLSLALLPDRLAAFGATVAALIVTPLVTLGGNSLVYRYLVPEGVAWALVVPALVLFVRQRRGAAAVLLGLAMWMQPLAGLLVALALGLVALWEAAAAAQRRAALLDAIRYGLVFGLTAAPLLVPMLLHQVGASGSEDGALSGFYLYARLRVPHHYLPSAFGLANAVQFVLLIGLGTAGFVRLAKAGTLRHAAFLRRFALVAAGILILATVAVVGFESLSLARIQPFKLTVPLTLLMTIGLVGGAVGLLPDAHRAALARALDARALPAGLALCIGLTAVLAGAGLGRAGRQYRPAVHAASDLGRVEAWARTHTPTDALVAVPPTNTTFRVHARRSVVATWKAFPFQTPRMRQWLDRLRTVAPAPLPADGRGYAAVLDSTYFANPPAVWARLADSLGVDYALLDARRTPTPPPADPAFASGPWALYPLDR